MENVYDIRKNEKLMYILQKDNSAFAPKDELLSTVAIAVYLYYEDTLDIYFSYLDVIPEQISLYIISSRQVILDRTRSRFPERKNMVFLRKKNRGRDVSVLLVTFREVALQYQYICFLHDKKAKHSRMEEDIEIWIKNLWENTIGSKDYIYNVLQILEGSPQIGLLVPPEPLGQHFAAWYGDAWGSNFGNTERLCKELNVKDCDLNREKYPITLSTVFWVRTESLRKIFLKEWKYEDFPEEPMPIDGTISHALERIWGYVVQDAGYKTGTVMTASYAEWSLLFIQQEIRKMYRILRDEVSIQTLHQID